MKARTKPNILMFIPHDCGDHLACYGHQAVSSPNLDRLAADGVKFERCYTTAPECTPSRSGLYTGLYTHQNGLMGLTHRGWSLASDVPHLAKRLWHGGYRTHLFGMQHETYRSPAELGYNCTAAQQSAGSSNAVCLEVADFLTHAESNDHPWFACVGLQDTHRPWRPASDFGPEDVEVPPYLPDLPETRADLAELYQAVSDMDTAVGRALDALETSGIAGDTVVIYTSDHGIPFPRAKSTFYEAGIKVPFILRWPGRIEGGACVSDLASNLDFCPTILDLCGIESVEKLEGTSWAPLFDGRGGRNRDAVFGVLYYDSRYDPMAYVRTDRYKYVRSFAVTPEDRAAADQGMLAEHACGTFIRADDSDVQGSPTWRAMKKRQTFPAPPEQELYDLENDPLELRNLADSGGHRVALADLKGRLESVLRGTGSPLPDGHVSPDLSATGNERW